MVLAIIITAAIAGLAGVLFGYFAGERNDKHHYDAEVTNLYARLTDKHIEIAQLRESLNFYYSAFALQKSKVAKWEEWAKTMPSKHYSM